MPLKHTVEELKLENGVTGLLLHTPGATAIHSHISFRAGNHYVRDQKISQAAHIMEHMSLGANAEYSSAEAFSREFTMNGAYNNASTSTIAMTYVADAALMEWDRILRLQRLAITKPVYTQQTLDAEKGNVREELTGYLRDHYRIIWQEVMRAAGLERWYDPGELKTVDDVALDDIYDHFKRTHMLRNMRFVIAGDLSSHRDAIMEHFETYDLAEGNELELPREEAQATGPVLIKRSDVSNLIFQLTFFINRPLSRQEITTMNTLNHILKGTFHSRIWGEARRRGICYGLWAWIDVDDRGVTEWTISAEVSRENATELFALISQQLRSVEKDGVTDEELEEAKSYRIGSHQLGGDTVGSLADWYEEYYFTDRTINYADELPDLYKATTQDDLKKLIAEFLSTDAWGFGGLGNIDEAELQEHYDHFEKTLGKG